MPIRFGGQECGGNQTQGGTMKRIAAVIPAGGYGTLDGRSCKLLAKIGGKAILLRVVEAVKAAGFSPVVVVVNKKYGKDIRAAVQEEGHFDVDYVDQPYRRGAADAVMQAVETLNGEETKNFLAVLGEMLFMSPGTMTELAREHITRQAHMSYLTCPHDPAHPLASHMEEYAFVDYESEGRLRVPMYSGRRPSRGTDVIGSAYVFRLEWFKLTFPRIIPMDKQDGFGVEYHLPAFVELAANNGYRFVNFRKFVPLEIFGINTPKHFEVAEQISESVVT